MSTAMKTAECYYTHITLGTDVVSCRCFQKEKVTHTPLRLNLTNYTD